jgi:hypothetical protein
VFGAFAFRSAPHPSDPEAVAITDGWDKANIRMFEIPQLCGVTGAPKSGLVPFHRLAGPVFVDFFAEVERAGLLHHVRTWHGSWVPRFIRGSRSVLSNHAYGTACDINYRWNPLGATPTLRGREGSVRELVPIANELGIYWGGHFSVDAFGRPVVGADGSGPRVDGCHFEIARLR